MVLLIQPTEGMRLIISSSVACLALPDFSTFSHKRYDFFPGGRGGAVEHNMFVRFFSTNFVSNISRFKNNSARYHTCV